MTLTHAMGVHGHSMQIEYEDRLHSIRRRGSAIMIEGHSGTDNWFHFAIPTPVIVNDKRLRAVSVSVLFMTYSSDAHITAIHVWDGTIRIATYENIHLSSLHKWDSHRFDVPGNPEIRWGVGISIHVDFGIDSESYIMEFGSAGCDFI